MTTVVLLLLPPLLITALMLLLGKMLASGPVEPAAEPATKATASDDAVPEFIEEVRTAA